MNDSTSPFWRRLFSAAEFQTHSCRLVKQEVRYTQDDRTPTLFEEGVVLFECLWRICSNVYEEFVRMFMKNLFECLWRICSNVYEEFVQMFMKGLFVRMLWIRVIPIRMFKRRDISVRMLWRRDISVRMLWRGDISVRMFKRRDIPVRIFKRGTFLFKCLRRRGFLLCLFCTKGNIGTSNHS
jgi:hypothetical protein